jgi:hypothetical protein
VLGSSSAWTVSPVRVVVAPIVPTTTSWLVSGRPRQLLLIRENSRCSIWGEMRWVSAGVWACANGRAAPDDPTRSGSYAAAVARVTV